MKIAVFGAAGLLGKEIVEHCRENKIVFEAPSKQEVDIRSFAQISEWIKKKRPTHIINCAAYTKVDQAEHEREEAFLLNCSSVGYLALAAKESASRLIHISTDYVFSGDRELPYEENAPCHPVNYYGVTKRAGEEKLFSILPGATLVRTSWLFGKGGKNFLSSLLTMMQQKQQLRIVADQVSRPTCAKELAKAVVALADKEGIYHFANRGRVSRYQMAQDLLRILNERGVKTVCDSIIPEKAECFPLPAARPRISCLDTTKTEALLGEILDWNVVAQRYVDEVCA